MRKLAEEDDSGEDFDMPEAEPKIEKINASYIEFGPFKCGECNMYYHDEDGEGKCTYVQGQISGADGSCYFWAPRLTQPIKGKKYNPPLTQKESGYVEFPGGTSCSTCKLFLPETRGCKMVKGDIDPLGCCNGWTPRNDLKDYMISEANYKKIFKFYGITDL